MNDKLIFTCDEETILKCIDFTLYAKQGWTPPLEYRGTNVSDTIVKILLGK